MRKIYLRSIKSIKEQETKDLKRVGDLILKGGVSAQLKEVRRTFANNLNKSEPISEEWFKAILNEHNLTIRTKLPNNKALRWTQNFVVDNYILDFAFIAQKVGIEVDDISHKNKKFKDELRQAYIERLGWKILRVPHKDLGKALQIVKVMGKLKLLIHSGITQRADGTYLKGIELYDFCKNFPLEGLDKERQKLIDSRAKVKKRESKKNHFSFQATLEEMNVEGLLRVKSRLENKAGKKDQAFRDKCLKKLDKVKKNSGNVLRILLKINTLK